MSTLKTLGQIKRNPKEYGKVAVLMGGDSAEREISLISGKYALDNLKAAGVDAHAVDVRQTTIIEKLQAGNFDHAVIVLHGRGGEDGKIQALLETLNIPYSGSGVLASALTMNKHLTKQVWQAAGLPVVPGRLVDDNTDLDALVADYGLPMAIKAVHEGSTLGTSCVTKREDLPAAIAESKKYDQLVIAEPWIQGDEYTVGVVGEDVLPSIKIVPAKGFYDFYTKYQANDTQYLLPSGLSDVEEAQLRKLVKQAFDVLNCKGWARADILRGADGQFLLLEINTIPGLTDHSLVPKEVTYLGYNGQDLMLAILESAFKREAQQLDTETAL
jgi:D-alanine-D-alanine ligase